MRLFFTGALSFLGPQANPRLSLGGLISSSPVPNDSLNAIFGTISDYEASRGSKQTIGLVLRNESGSEITSGNIWYENNSVSPISNIRMSVVEIGTDPCGDLFIEQLQSTQASPTSASFSDNRGEVNAISIPTIPINGYVGVWIERTINTFAVKQSMDCENLYQLHIAEARPQKQTITTVADISNSLGGSYWILNTVNGSFYVWYDTGASPNPNLAGIEGVKVSINENDSSEFVAQKTKSKLDEILVPRGEITTDLSENIITIVNTEAGSVLESKAQTSGFTINIIEEGINNTLEEIENISLFIDY